MRLSIKPWLLATILVAFWGTSPSPAAEEADERISADDKAQPIDPRVLKTQREQRDSQRQQYLALPEVREAALENLMQLRLVGGYFTLDTLPAVGLEQLFRLRGSSNCYLSIDRSTSGTAIVKDGILQTVTVPTGVVWIDSAATDDATVWYVSAAVQGEVFSINAQSVLGRVSLLQFTSAALPANLEHKRVTLNVTEWHGTRLLPIFREAAASVDALRANHPVEFRRYLEPIVAKLAGTGWITPGAADVYSAFDTIPADPATTAQLSLLLPRLDATDFAEREAAAAELAAMGDPAVLAALRFDTNDLTPEQAAQLGNVVNKSRRRTTANAIGADPWFLVDCFEFPDPRVRTQAKAALESLLRQPVAFDPMSSPQALAEQADAVRKQVNEWQATTRPTR